MARLTTQDEILSLASNLGMRSLLALVVKV
jgi:hypothetical protein